jgi:pimeloyl-ACP methyl ester carboxylesterase
MTSRPLNARIAASVRRSPVTTGIASGVVALAVAAVVNRYLAKKAERDNPPVGRFVEVDGVKLHYVDRGSGDPVVLLHGNGSMIQDFESSGLIDMASRKYRVIALDRPGFGHSARPRGIIWTPEKQADLVHRALTQIGISRATVLGHSWGASVAVALALKHPEFVAGVVLASGYYYPTVRGDVLLLSGPAVPVIGDIVSHTVAPLLSRLLWPLLLKKIFGPAPVPNKFREFPKEMAVRPSQIRASAEETALLIPSAFAQRGEYASLRMPVVIIAGEQDRLIDIDQQSAHLHQDVKQSKFRPVTNAGHMVHQTATARVLAAIDEAVAPSSITSLTKGSVTQLEHQ